jgi:hypothetical protein
VAFIPVVYSAFSVIDFRIFSLQVLRLWHNDIGDSGARALAISLKSVGNWGSLRKLHLSAHEIGPFENTRKSGSALSSTFKVVLSR